MDSEVSTVQGEKRCLITRQIVEKTLLPLTTIGGVQMLIQVRLSP